MANDLLPEPKYEDWVRSIINQYPNASVGETVKLVMNSVRGMTNPRMVEIEVKRQKALPSEVIVISAEASSMLDDLKRIDYAGRGVHLSNGELVSNLIAEAWHIAKMNEDVPPMDVALERLKASQKPRI